MKKGFNFFVQRAPGTTAECLTEEDRADKELFEAHFADCKTYADLYLKLEKMTSKQGNKGDQDYLEKETNQDVFGKRRILVRGKELQSLMRNMKSSDKTI